MRATLASGAAVDIVTVAERPHHAGIDIDVGTWPSFMRHNRISEAYFWQTDRANGVDADVGCALNISVAKSLQGQGLAGLMPHALRNAVAAAGLSTLVAPVRPTRKDREPQLPMADYVARTRTDGLPWDPWLRTHVRAGGQIAGIAPASWVVAGSLSEWRDWTGLPFDLDGSVDVPGALVPVHCDVAGDHAVYVEPNVWVRHGIQPDPGAFCEL